MKHACCILLLLLTSTLGFATSTQITFGNQGGMLTGSNAGLSVTGSTLTSITGFLGPGTLEIGALGTVEFTTGSLLGGSLATGAIFNAGGTFTVTSNGSEGLPSGVLFSGTFASPVTWILVTLANGTHAYVINGVMTGTLANGTEVNAVEVQLTVNLGKSLFSTKGGTVTLSGGSTVITQGAGATVPEPSSLSLIGTGLLALAGLAKRRLSARLV